jgi:hypothetical protein
MSRLRPIRLLTLITALLLGATTILVSATPASAAGCRAGSCTGKDPQVQRCAADAQTIDEFTVGRARVELRYSPRCHAAWTRVTSPQHYNTIFGQIRGGGHVYGVQATQGQHWTKMIGRNHQVRACYAIGHTASPSGCTRWH